MVPWRRFLFSLVLLGAILRVSHGAGTVEKRVDLRITNDLGTGENLSHHCKSRDDDLGAHVLAPNQFSEFRFRPNFWGTTLYFCRFWWGRESHWFDIYVQKRDAGRCNSKCWWMVGPNGPCLLDGKFGVYTLCQGWNDNGLALKRTLQVAKYRLNNVI